MFHSRRTWGLHYLNEARNLKTLSLYIDESSPKYRRRQHEPAAPVDYMVDKTYGHDNFRLNRNLRTIQGLDYINALRGMGHIALWDYNKWVMDGDEKQLVHDRDFLNNMNRRIRQDKSAAQKSHETLASIMSKLVRNYKAKTVKIDEDDRAVTQRVFEARYPVQREMAKLVRMLPMVPLPPVPPPVAHAGNPNGGLTPGFGPGGGGPPDDPPNPPDDDPSSGQGGFSATSTQQQQSAIEIVDLSNEDQVIVVDDDEDGGMELEPPPAASPSQAPPQIVEIPDEGPLMFSPGPYSPTSPPTGQSHPNLSDSVSFGSMSVASSEDGTHSTPASPSLFVGYGSPQPSLPPVSDAYLDPEIQHIVNGEDEGLEGKDDEDEEEEEDEDMADSNDSGSDDNDVDSDNQSNNSSFAASYAGSDAGFVDSTAQIPRSTPTSSTATTAISRSLPPSPQITSSGIDMTDVAARSRSCPLSLVNHSSWNFSGLEGETLRGSSLANAMEIEDDPPLKEERENSFFDSGVHDGNSAENPFDVDEDRPAFGRIDLEVIDDDDVIMVD